LTWAPAQVDHRCAKPPAHPADNLPFIDAEATIRVLDRAYIDLTSPIGRGFMAFISAMAEDERLRIIKRTHEGRAIARENGVKMGRKFRLNDVQRAEARQRLANGEAASHLAKVYGVSRATIYRV
jgi:DNA invertase Pin-like site-specific DNA recombinase